MWASLNWFCCKSLPTQATKSPHLKVLYVKILRMHTFVLNWHLLSGIIFLIGMTTPVYLVSLFEMSVGWHCLIGTVCIISYWGSWNCFCILFLLSSLSSKDKNYLGILNCNIIMWLYVCTRNSVKWRHLPTIKISRK